MSGIEPQPLRVLFIEDDPNDLELGMRELQRAGWQLDWLRVDTPDALKAALTEHEWHVVVCDYRLGPFEAPEALRIVRSADPDVPFIVVSGTVGEEIAAELMRVGAQDFVMKTNYRRLVPAILRELSEADTRRRNRDAEDQIRESEFRFRQITESISEAFWLATPGITEFLYASPAFERITGKTVDEINHDPAGLLDIVHPDDRGSVVEAFSDTSEEGFTAEYRVVKPDGSTRWIYTRGTPILDTDGAVVRVAGVSTDVTDRHEAEAGLRASLDALRQSEGERRLLVQQLVRASEEERARLAGDVHDDSVQAMTAVGMRLETLKRRLGDPDREAEVDQLQATVSDAVSRLRRLLFELRPPALDQHGVAAALRELLDRLDIRSRLDASGFEEPPDELRTILYRVAQESLANVRKHASASSVTVALESGADGWRVRIADDGVGFAPDDEERDPMHMGMASMRERAEMAAGTCSVTSAPGAGTTVEVFLPRPAA